MKILLPFLYVFLLLGLAGCKDQPETRSPDEDTIKWAEGAVWYQIFPERFRNGDPGNDPRAGEVPWAEFQQGWQIHPWTSDWYKVQPWERTHTDAFYTVVYQRRYGGDLIGVIGKLDYLKDLGIDAIYFNPLFEGESLHKYDGANFHHIDDNFGPDPAGDKQRLAEAKETGQPETWIWTSADSTFLRLLKEAHERNIKVVIDGVFNHSGTAFFAFKDVRENQQESPYAGWYDVTQWENPATDVDEFDYKGWWDDKTLPVFREDENGLVEGPREYIFHIVRRWMDPDGDGDPSDGVDGWRLDAADEVSEAFWKDWYAHVKSINPGAVCVAENWSPAGEWIREGWFDAVTNYPFAYAMLDFFINREKAITGIELGQRLNELVSVYGQDNMTRLWNLVESHDTERIASMILNPDRRGFDRDGSLRDNLDYRVRKPNGKERNVHRQIAAFQMTFIGSPVIYYGTEAGMWGADDPDNRKPMLWKDLSYEVEVHHPVKDKSRPANKNVFDQQLFEFYKQLIRLRQNNTALRSGIFSVLEEAATEDVFGFIRKDSEQEVICVFNRNMEPHILKLERENLASKIFRNGLSGEQVHITPTEGSIKIPASGFVILISED